MAHRNHSPAHPAPAGRLKVASVLAGIAALTACTSMQDIPPGTAFSQVQASYGAPSVECPAADGTRHVVWSSQPMGQYAWGATVGPDDTVGRVEQVLTDASFGRVKSGDWNAEQLRCAFGPPAETTVVGPPGSQQRVWTYRYKQSGAWNSLMHFYLSDDGRVTRMHPGPDPMYDTPEPFFF